MSDQYAYEGSAAEYRNFLDGVSATKGRWREVTASVDGLLPHYFWSGQGRDALEVALASASRKLTATEAREVWKSRQGRAASPLLLVVAFNSPTGDRAVLCGPIGDSPPVVELELGQAERIASAALQEGNRHLAVRMLSAALEQSREEVPGLRNHGLLATHELITGVPQRIDWASASAHGKANLKCRHHDLVRSLGYQLQQVGQHHVLRTTSGNARAVAVLLQENEQPDQPSFRYDLQTPVTYALAQADRENLPWVVSVRGGTIRLYSTATSGAAGQRGRAETFVELDLSLLPEDKAGYLHLLFSSEALTKDGTLYEIQQASRDYSALLSERLRDRVYDEVVPRLAIAVAKRVGGTAEQDLRQHYRTALTILFRLLFISYAEDSKLLPLHVNGEYTDHSLKSMARRFTEGINSGRDLGFDDPLAGRKSQHPDEDQLDLWTSCKTLFQAVDKGHGRWGVPAYNGGLFSADPAVNPVGGVIEDLDFSNAEFGPALATLIVDQGPDGELGPIDFRSLSVREFGTIYEGLLESELSVADQDLTLGRDGTYLPVKDEDEVVVAEGEVYLHNASGQRKSSGSYFTKPFAVDHLLDHALEPTLEEHLERIASLLDEGREADAAESLFDFRVADISMGSGHFLTAVVDRIEAKLSGFLAEHPIPNVSVELDTLRQHAIKALGENANAIEIENSSLLRRLIARRCVYGVDLNPISVELARVSMWIHTFVPGLPLSFLNHNLAIGDSVTGIATIEEATSAIELKRGMNYGLFNDPLREALREAEGPLRKLARIIDGTPEDVASARMTAEEVRRAVEPVTAFFDVTVAVRLGRRGAPAIGSAKDLLGLTEDPSRRVVDELNSLHFPIAFPEVFLRERPGFDVIVGNPPWEKVKVETHEFWGRHFPGFRGLSQKEKEEAGERFERERPDLGDALEAEREAATKLSKIVKSGPYDLGSGDTELARVFAWRFWHLLREGGRFGVVLPRQATLAAPGMKSWRKQILDEGAFEDVTLVENKGYWAFDDVEPRYTIGFVTVLKGGEGGSLSLRGPYRSRDAYQVGLGRQMEIISASEFKLWSKDLIFPTLSEPTDAGIYRALLRQPRIGDPRSDWTFRPLAEVHATGDKELYTFSDGRPPDSWPVYSGSSFNIWIPETGEIYAWADENVITGHLFEKRRRQAEHAKSAFFGMDPAVINDSSTLPARSPRIAFRDVTNRTNQRTLIVALIPPDIVVQHKAPYLVRVSADMADEAYLLGVMSTRILDWYARRMAETGITFAVFNSFPVPLVNEGHRGWQRIVELAGRLAAVDERYSIWANEVGVEYGPIPPAEADDMKAELDACVARLYGLEEQQIRDLYATFHPTWDHEPWTEAVLEHYRKIDWDPAEVPK